MNRFEKARHYTEKYRGKLEPCPYCKTDVDIVSDRTIFTTPTKVVFGVCCPNCGDAAADSTSVRRAIDNWNHHVAGLKED